MKIQILNQIQFDKFIFSFDLALFALQIFDPYSYNFFLQKLQKKKNLLFIVFYLRSQNQINLCFSKYNKNLISEFLDNQIFFYKDLKEILIIFSETLNVKFCYQKLNLISFFFLPEYSFFVTQLKIKCFMEINFFSFWLIFYNRRLNFIFPKLFPIYCKNKICNNIGILFLQNGLRFLNFYKNL